MRVRQGRAAIPKPAQKPAAFEYHTFPAPVRGWVVNENLATAQPAAARRLENFFPTTTGIRARGGARKWATVGDLAPVISMWTFNSGTTEEFFAATASSIFDITAPASATVIPTADVTGRTAGYYATAQIGTAGGNYLYAVNGADSALLYDGTTWLAVTAVSSTAITGVTTSTFSHVWTYASRLFFVEKDTMRAWYLPVDSIGGAAVSLSLAGVFQRGGALLFGATWSLDAGDGLDDKCVFVSSKGEVAVYEGINPASASDWRKVGVYRITDPLGIKATMHAGGDLLVATEDGIVPLSEAIQKDSAALSLAAVTKSIESEWKKEVRARSTRNWEIAKWASNNMMLVSQPITDSQDPQMLVANLETGAWCKFTGWDTRCLAVFNDYGYFGTNDGYVFQMEVGGSDDGDAYTCIYIGQFEHMGSPGATKTVGLARATFLSTANFLPQISASVNYGVVLPAAPNSIADYQLNEWDSGLWDVAIWDSNSSYSVTARWVLIGQTGYSIAPQIQITCGVTPLPRIELVSVDMTFQRGGLVV